MSVKGTNLQFFILDVHFDIYVSIYLEKLGRLQELSIVIFVFIAGLFICIFWT